MLNGVMLLWFVLTAMALVFVALDIRKAPIPAVLKCGSVLLTAAVTSTFLPELLSMNLVMSGMMVVASLGRSALGGGFSPLTPEFWFVMSMALLAGFLTAYPMNWWLVAKRLKHGMMTVRDPDVAHHAGIPSHPTHPPVIASSNEGHVHHANVSRKQITWMTILSVVVFALAFAAQAEVTVIGINDRSAHAADAATAGQGAAP